MGGVLEMEGFVEVWVGTGGRRLRNESYSEWFVKTHFLGSSSSNSKFASAMKRSLSTPPEVFAFLEGYHCEKLSTGVLNLSCGLGSLTACKRDASNGAFLSSTFRYSNEFKNSFKQRSAHVKCIPVSALPQLSESSMLSCDQSIGREFCPRFHRKQRS